MPVLQVRFSFFGSKNTKSEKDYVSLYLELQNGATMRIIAVKPLRRELTFAPDSAISDVGRALRKNVDNKLLDEVLGRMSVDARNFWNPEYIDYLDF